MPTIHLFTFINAPVERVFNLARSITLHEKSMEHTTEQAVAGTTSGLIENGETVTWQARHLGKTRMLKVHITAMEPFTYFRDEMLEGDFKTMAHNHYFTAPGDGTVMVDEFSFTSPYGLVGKLFNAIFLTRYMTRLLQQRNTIIKEYAESHKWKTVLP